MANEALLNESIDVYIHFLKYLDAFVSKPAAEYNISFEQYLILHDVSQEADLTLMEIASRRNVTRSAVSRQIRSLLSKQLIKQSPDRADRRRLKLSLTARGKTAEAQISERVTHRFSAWINEFGETQAKQVLTFIREFGTKFADEDQ
ncbi:MarR family winged helix-turn-helix transcriptional regulator [Furfurilactobacillus siliginis]|uniref:Transcriptional regulator n=1 Tax=Furfurilactobacillus siliginis TaxID=348151 RepID=A0A0R2LDH2_9LACO|nr:MarR family transcriptional regulator [Furfurilactobacillus siliginis]KRN96669.1 transcriptional regulator [Furfurilactobacillus siliginis]GEK29099.1 MarR family transcriptional regulator [Furfurilactobacillus siliginis]